MKATIDSRLICVLSLSLVSIPAWAATIEAPGIPNFHQVDEHVYRSAQPKDEGWKNLAKLGVKTVIDLRRPDEHSTDAEAKAVEAAGMHYVNVPMQGVVAPPDGAITKILALMNSRTDGPVLVHCKRGADRTGTVIAAYRMTHDHWQNGKAMQEAKSYGMRWTQVGMKQYISNFQAPAEAAAAETNLQAVARP
jgi:tyrosine-protein phosphatase SIW14